MAGKENHDERKDMPEVMRDENGPWMDVGPAGAIRPVVPTRFAEGDEVDEFHFKQSIVHGVGKLSGRGVYQEAWISGPKPGEAPTLGLPIERAWANHWRELGEFARATAGLPSQGGGVNVETLKKRLEKYRLSSIGIAEMVDFLVWFEKSELARDGQAMAAEVAARFDADALDRSLPAESGPKFARKPAL